jgi:glycosyltransferase involved in cell wall biosynthesis
MTTPRNDSRLRVAIISPTFGGYGGMEASVLALARGLIGSPTTEVRLFFKMTSQFRLEPALAEAMAQLGSAVQVIRRGSTELRRAIAWAQVVQVQNPSPDVVLLAKLHRRPLLINVINHRPLRGSWRRLAWQFSLRCAERRFYISDFVRRSWEGAVCRPNSRVVFPFCELAGDPLPPEQRRGFVFAARWIANKGLDTLVDAYAQAALDPVAWPLCLIGDGPLRPTIEARISERRLRGCEIRGFLSAEKKAAAIRAARWMVVPPNTREDFGLTAIEARHLRVPCIITRDGGVPEAAGDEALACPPGDVTALADCLRTAAAMSENEYRRRAQRT